MKMFGNKNFKIRSIGSYIRFLHFKQLIRGLSFASILDAGCGGGEFAVYIHKAYPNAKVEGCDTNGTAIKENKKAAKNLGKNIAFFEKDLQKLTFKKRFDLIYCIDALEHIKEYKKVIKNFAKAIKSNGYFYIHIPLKNSRKRRRMPNFFFKKFDLWLEEEHVGLQNAKEAEHLLKKENFKIIKKVESFNNIGMVLWEIDYILRNSTVSMLHPLIFPILKIIALLDLRTIGKESCGLAILAQKK